MMMCEVLWCCYGTDTGSHNAIATAIDTDACSPRGILLLRLLSYRKTASTSSLGLSVPLLLQMPVEVVLLGGQF